jgi:transposase-like protein
MMVREIQGHLAELYGTEVSPDLISKATDAILDEVREWQSRPLESIYPVVFFDALRVKIRDEGMVKNKAVFPNDEAATKLLYLAIRNAGIHWRRPVAWTAAMGQFAIQFGERFAGSAD